MLYRLMAVGTPARLGSLAGCWHVSRAVGLDLKLRLPGAGRSCNFVRVVDWEITVPGEPVPVPRGPSPSLTRKEGVNTVEPCHQWRVGRRTVVGSVGEADVEPQSFENGVRRHLNACVNVLNSLPPWTARVSRQDSWPD